MLSSGLWTPDYILLADGDFVDCYLVEKEPAVAIVRGIEAHDIEGELDCVRDSGYLGGDDEIVVSRCSRCG